MSIHKIKNCIEHSLQTLSQKDRISTRDIAIFLRQFATLLTAGIPIIQSCNLLEKSQEKIKLRLLIQAIKKELLAGKNLSYCLQHHTYYFDKLTCELIQIGENTGKLDTMLTAVANHQEKNLALRKRVKQALFYPSIVTMTAFIVTLSMFIFIIPKFAELFQDAQKELPLLTVCIFYFVAKLKQYLLWLSTAAFLCAFILFRSKRSAHYKHYLLYAVCSLPLIKNCIRKMTLARFTRNLAITFSAGIPITNALKLIANTCNNKEFSDLIATLRSKICTGMQLHHAMESSSYFPQLMIQMVKVGEESGKIEYMLDKMADLLESDIDQLFHYLNQLLEPLIMIILGALIGGLVIGMYLPIFKLGSAL